MARLKSEDKRAAIMGATIQAIATDGIQVSTATIAKEAGISTGSLFTYFDSKAELFSTLYVEIKTDMAKSTLTDLPVNAELREQFSFWWNNWMNWAMANPNKFKALDKLKTSKYISEGDRLKAMKEMEGFDNMLNKSRADGPMADVSLEYLIALMNSMAEATMAFIIHDPKRAKEHRRISFDALWRMITK